jgi:hypothetical protein
MSKQFNETEVRRRFQEHYEELNAQDASETVLEQPASC